MKRIYLAAGLAAVLLLGGCTSIEPVSTAETATEPEPTEQASGDTTIIKTVYQYEEQEPEPEAPVVVEQLPPVVEVDAPNPPPVVVSKTYVPSCPGPGFSSVWTKNQAVHAASTQERKADFLSCPIIPKPVAVPVPVPKPVVVEKPVVVPRPIPVPTPAPTPPPTKQPEVKTKTTPQVTPQPKSR